MKRATATAIRAILIAGIGAASACAPSSTGNKTGTGGGGASTGGTTGAAGSGAAGTTGTAGTGVGGVGGAAAGTGGSTGASGGTTGGGGSVGAGATAGGGSGGVGAIGGIGGRGGTTGVGGVAGTGAAGRGGVGGTATAGTGGRGGTTGSGGGGTTGTGGQTAPVVQTTQGTKAALTLLDHFDGIPGNGDPSDLSLAVGPNHIVQAVNWQIAVYTKKGNMYSTTGMSLGTKASKSIFAGLGGRCEAGSDIDHGDTVVRYDQLAGRWVFIQPVFASPYAMCYAVSTSADPLGSYNKYEFARAEFPDYPRLGVWPDGYYVGTSAGDDVVQKRICVADRAKMLMGQPATEQCIIIDGVNFLNNADIDGKQLPPPGAPNIMMAAGGTQLKKVLEDNGIFVWKFHVDWKKPENTKVVGPEKIVVAPYHYLCDGQLTNCVPQPGTDRRLDAQGDKIMQRLVYRRIGGRESIVGVHSVNTSAGGGGVRWYELRINKKRNVNLYQQGTYAPDGFYRWMASPAIDRKGNIGIGYSFGGTPNFAGQRFAGRLYKDPLGQLTLRETVLVEGEGVQNVMRWEDYTQSAIDPSDDCTIWYVGDYLKKDATSYSSRIGAFKLPGCR